MREAAGSVWSLGVGEVVLPLLFWIPAFFAATLVINLFVVRACRRRLRSSGRETGLATLLLVVPLCVLGPIFAGCLGVPFSLQRSVGALVERGGRALMSRAASLGEPEARAALHVRSDDQFVDLQLARERIHLRLEAILITDRKPSLFGRRKDLPEQLDRAYLHAFELATYTFPLERQVPFRELAARARKPLELSGAHLPGANFLHVYADGCYSAARNILYLWLLLLFAADGLALLIVYLISRRPPAAVAGAGTTKAA